ncbi:ATP-binding protein [Phaeobacter italicus]|uniref:HD domain-containing protein n=1 Tax=Phaeobacter italicus TaxID=481446 RepID=UPI001ADA44BC|nr:ATP-binding protein [Phaeobacter italicus]MBO9441127.1 ATP-binding protein [Phaeobacter italicus]
MKISEVILERIKGNYALDGYVKGSVARISEHIASNKLVFFPEYTDHDVTHFEAVLETAVDLATDKSLELMTDIDFAALTTSVMLHDLGMHLTKDGFETLVSPKSPMVAIEGFGDLPWNELWVTFLAEAKRFDAKKLEALFGSNYKPVTAFPSFSEPWNEFDILLVGEFLRRHHPRLAHEIALHGMPSKDGTLIQFCNDTSEQDRFLNDISGLIARSHGLALRDTFSYLEKHYNNKIETRSAHPVFLMTLLRVADYLQIQSARAPSARTDVSKFKSPVSSREWSVHQCVTDISNISDPEAIDITAHPQDIDTFLRLEYWIRDLQRELDMSWAVLGEVYGLHAHSGLNKLGLRIRRLRSNIDDAESFSQSVTYIPEQIAFTTAGSELLKLLVGPLYANDISVGLRELVQNATDAVKELDSLVNEGVIEPTEGRTDITADVQVDFVQDSCDREPPTPEIVEVTITDRGVGMTADIIKNYFLKAGASFRSSDVWKKQFEESDGTIRVQRSGRFGVGALAAFLIGDEIEVETRHYSEPTENGLRFSTSIEATSINIEKVACAVGTKIRIKIPEHLQGKVGNLLGYSREREVNQYNGISQYFGRKPSLKYKIDEKDIPWDEKCFLPTKVSSFEGGWNYFETDDYEVNWSFESGKPALSVNQILVSGTRTNRRMSGGTNNAGIKLGSDIFVTPALSIGDKSGSFPLNLQRNAYAGSKIPFQTELATEVTDELLFTCLWYLSLKEQSSFPNYAGLKNLASWNRSGFRWLHCSDGMVLNNPRFLQAYNPQFALARYGGVDDWAVAQAIVDSLPKQSLFIHEANEEFSARNFNMKGKLTRILQGDAHYFTRKATKSQTVFVPSSFVDLIIKKMKPGKDATKALDGLVQDADSNWLVQNAHGVKEPEAVQKWRKQLSNDGLDTSVVSLHELSCSEQPLKESLDQVVFERWMEIIGQPYLPKSASDAKELQKTLMGKLGEKYKIFEQRANEKKQRQKDKAKKQGSGYS